MNIKSLVAVVFSTLVSIPFTLAAPPITEPVDAIVVNKIPFENMSPVGSRTTSGPGSISARAQLPSGRLHAFSLSISSVGDITCEGFMALTIRNIGDDSEFASRGFLPLYVPLGRTVTIANTLTSPIEIKVDDANHRLNLEFRGQAVGDGFCTIDLGGIHEEL